MQELKHKRTINSKTYALEGGERKLVLGKYPLHFENEGKLRTINLTPRFDEGRNQYTLRDCPYSLCVSNVTPAYAYNSLNGKRVSVELETSSSIPVVEGELFKWAEVGLDTDYVIQPLPVGCSTLLFLHSKNSPRKWRWKILGDMDLINPLTGKDSGGRRLELVERRDKISGVVEVEWTGRTTSSKLLRNKKRIVYTEEVTYPALIDPTVNETVVASADDANSTWNGGGATFSQFSSNGLGLRAGRLGDYRYYAGIRFQTIPIPVGATITSATLSLSSTDVGTPNINVFGNDVDDAAIYSDPGNRIKNIVKTTAVTNKANWVNNAVNTVTVTSIVAEILARAGWASNNDIAFGFFNAATAGGHYLTIDPFELGGTIPVLQILYNVAGATLSPPFPNPSSITTLLRR